MEDDGSLKEVYKISLQNIGTKVSILKGMKPVKDKPKKKK